MTRSALSEANGVDVHRTAQDMVRFIDQMYFREESINAGYEMGRRRIHSILSHIPISSAGARTITERLRQSPDFHWKFRPNMGGEVELAAAHGGVESFLRTYRYVESIGTAGEWSLRFHAANLDGYGDIIHYLADAFQPLVEMGFAEVYEAFDELGRRAHATHDEEERLALNRAAIAAAEEALYQLQQIAERPENGNNHGTTPGTSALWQGSGLSGTVIGALEGAATAAVSGIAALLTWLVLSYVAPGTADAVAQFFGDGGFAQIAGRATVAAIVGIPALAAGRLFVEAIHIPGVYNPNGSSPILDGNTIRGAVKTASSSVWWGVPFIAAAFVTPAAVSGLLVLIGVGVAVGVHAWKNAHATTLLTPDEARWAAVVRVRNDALAQAEKDGSDPDLLAVAVADAVGLQDLNTATLGVAPAGALPDVRAFRYDDSDLLDRVEGDPNWRSDVMFLHHAALTGARGVRVTTVGAAMTSSDIPGVSAGENRPNVETVVPVSGDGYDALATQVAAAQGIMAADGKPGDVLTIVLEGASDDDTARLREQFGQGRIPTRFLGDGDLQTLDAVEALIVRPALSQSRNVKLVLRERAGFSQQLWTALVILAQRPQYKGAVGWIFASALQASMPAIEAPAATVAAMAEFRAKTRSHA